MPCALSNDARWPNFYFVSAAIIRRLLEMFLVWVTKLKNNMDGKVIQGTGGKKIEKQR
jgi:hypothetical protein